MQPRLLTRLVATMLVAAAVAASTLHADEISDLLKKAGTAYDAGNYSEAISTLDYAGQLIRQKKGESLTKFLPNALSGWTAEEATNESAGGAMFGGMISVQRVYRKDDARVTIKISTDSPLLANLMAVYSNPMLIVSSGAKLETIKGEKAVVKFDAANKSGDINVVVGGKMLVNIEGSDLARADLTGYASAIDFAKLGAAP